MPVNEEKTAVVPVDDGPPLTPEEQAMVDAAWEKHKAAAPCIIPPAGWYCTRTRGHDGPCATHQLQASTQSSSRTEGEVVGLLRRAQRNLNAFTGPDPRALIDAARDDIQSALSDLATPPPAVSAEDAARVIAEAMWGPEAASVYFDTARMDQRYADSMYAAKAILALFRPLDDQGVKG